MKKVCYILFSFDGRIGRRQYCLVGFPVELLLFVLGVGAIGALFSLGALFGPAVFAVWFVLFVWVYFAVQIKRAHDLGRSGWRAVFSPAWVAFYAKGTEGLNQHGFPFGHPRHPQSGADS